MATTTGGTPYVTSTDLVANYPTSSLALANRTDVVASGGPVLVKTAGYTITIADILGGNKFLYNSASPGTFTLPTSSLVDGMVVEVAQIGAGALTVSGGTIVGTAATTAQYQGLRFIYSSIGTTWYSVAPSVTAPGLAIITPTSIANSGGSASASGGAVTFTNVTSISLNGVFTSAYDNYRIIYTCTGSDLTKIRLRVGGVDATGGSTYYRSGMFVYQGTVYGYNGTAGSEWQLGNNSGAGPYNFIADITSPALAANTFGFTTNLTPNNYCSQFTQHTVSTAYDGITIFQTTNTASGTVRVYGYKNS